MPIISRHQCRLGRIAASQEGTLGKYERIKYPLPTFLIQEIHDRDHLAFSRSNEIMLQALSIRQPLSSDRSLGHGQDPLELHGLFSLFLTP